MIMASSPSNSLSEPAIIEQVITEFFAKSLHIILESRSPYVSSRNHSADIFMSSPSSSSSSSSGRPRDKWFNLALRDCPAALENFDLWRQSNLEPLVVDVILINRKSKGPVFDDFLHEIKREKIVERWVVQYENRKSNSVQRELHSSGKRSSSSISHSSEIPSTYKKTYKRTIVLLRSLYATVRLLPAYKVFRDLNSSGQISPFSLSHKISSFVEPFTRVEDAEMNHFGFAPVDTPCGRLSLTVSYSPKLEDVISEPSTPISAQFIPDYVGSPKTDPLKRLHSLPSSGSLPTYVPFTRRHSWSNDQEVVPPVSSSPSPSYSDSRALSYIPNPRLPPRNPSAEQYPSTCPTSYNVSSLTHRKNTSFDEYWPSPPFSPSSSPSPPTHLPGTQLQNSLIRAESAPVSIPLSSRHGGGSGLLCQGLPPSPSRKSGKVGCLQADLLRAQVVTASASQTSPENKLQLKKGSGELHICTSLQKILYSGKDDAGNLAGRKLSSCSSPRIPSRSSSRFSIMDDFDDSDFSCPFAEDDEYLAGSCRVEPSDDVIHAADNLVSGELIPVRRSPDAVVGALVRILKTAAPLRQDFSNSAISSQVLEDEIRNQGVQHIKNKVGAEKFVADSGSMIATSGLFKSRTTAEAFKELKSYRDMKEMLLRQSGTKSSVDVDNLEKYAPEF